ncbi:MAG TPA: Hsp20/alpha crystallin family protein [Methylococcus sp.]|nr:Hsp20/alpha crystallin family protein [Methylococcus sp.]
MLTRDPLAWMWVEACEMLERTERLQRQLFQLHWLSRRRPNWEPPADVFETEHDLKVIVLLPGVAPDRVAVTVEGGLLIVAGERRLPILGPVTIHRLEIPYGWFEKRIRLPAMGYELIDSEFANGCLVINLGKPS